MNVDLDHLPPHKRQPLKDFSLACFKRVTQCYPPGAGHADGAAMLAEPLDLTPEYPSRHGNILPSNFSQVNDSCLHLAASERRFTLPPPA